jgi:hypothetical protein
VGDALFAPYTPDAMDSYPPLVTWLRFRFPNGYQASVVRGPYTYGGREGLWELAVLDRRGALCYDTPITPDVVGWLEVEQVVDLLRRIEALPPVVGQEVPGE